MSEIIESKHASEQGHWYSKDGSPAYTIIGKNGSERPTTLRDARKEGLVPSVTTIIQAAAKPGLINWMIDQAILAALTMPRLENEPEEAYIARIKKDSKEQASKAAERGTLIHAWVQQGFEDILSEGLGVPYYESAKKTLKAHCGDVEWMCERSFAVEGFGGKVDLFSEGYVIDIKTTDKDIQALKTWDEHAYQLSAYCYGLTGFTDWECGILYVNSQNAESTLIWVPDNEIKKGWDCFKALKDFYYSKTGL